MLCARACMIARRLWDQVFSVTMVRLFLYAVGVIAPMWASTFAVADECGVLKIAGYSALRTIGPMELRVLVSPEKERTDEVGGAGLVHITELGTLAGVILNPKDRNAVIVPAPTKPPLPPGLESVEKFVDRETAKDGLVTVSMGLKTPNGKEWMIQTRCRPDGIWVERKTKTPRGVVSMRQRDIRIGAISAAQFEMPSDYKVIQPSSQPPANTDLPSPH